MTTKHMINGKVTTSETHTNEINKIANKENTLFSRADYNGYVRQKVCEILNKSTLLLDRYSESVIASISSSLIVNATNDKQQIDAMFRDIKKLAIENSNDKKQEDI